MFSSPVKDVAETKIFVRRTSPTSQVLVYSMEYQAEIELAMILPLPKLRGTGEDAVIFIDLSTYPLFFKDMARGFPEPPKSLSLPQATVAAPILRVHEVGSFEASWVPTLSASLGSMADSDFPPKSGTSCPSMSIMDLQFSS
jgi:hypothetical protein